MKTAISIPDEVFEQVERAAKRLGLSRSELFTRAVKEYLGARLEANIKESYDIAFAEGADDVGEFRRTAARKALLGIDRSSE
jgi:metal-responsive CopG/Arc/MetJ family transcriptional regulator